MKISKRRLRQIIREERAKIYNTAQKASLNEARFGAGSIGFADWAPNRTPNFAKAYGKDARVVGTYYNNNSDLAEYGLPASGSQNNEAFDELKYSGAFKELQELMHTCEIQVDAWQEKYETMLVDADMEDVGVEVEETRIAVAELRQLANQFR
jgi:hypothetical protein